MPPVRVRFAPSPTGYVHVGNARTALFNWLFARHHGGAFVLRIEDTDVERSEARYESQLMEDLRWFGLDWDEGPDCGGAYGPYRQSEREQTYRELATQLIDAGQAYFCFCSAEQLELEREAMLKAGQQPKYSGRCRARPREEAARKVAAGEPAAIRLKIVDSVFNWNDVVHGPTQFTSDVIGDPILVRSGGQPAYNYAVVVDDHQMQISHVIRGDDHISNTPRQLAVYRAFGWQPPRFAHLSTILGGDRTRLSKRHGATSIESFRKMGILPEALRNYLALLGWSPGDGATEILSVEEMQKLFSLEQITRSAAVFDNHKLYWLNRHYMKQAAPARLAELSAPLLAEAGYLRLGEGGERARVLAWLEDVVEAVLKNLDYLEQLPQAVKLVFDYDGRAAAALLGGDPAAAQVIEAFLERMPRDEALTYARFREIARQVTQATGKRGKELFHPLRVALTAADSGPELEKMIPVFEQGAALRLERPVLSVLERLRAFAAAAGLRASSAG